jgi:hypothetical protein
VKIAGQTFKGVICYFAFFMCGRGHVMDVSDCEILCVYAGL